MPDVTGAFKPDVPTERQRTLLERLTRRPGVRAAGLIKADAKSPDMRLLFYVRTDENNAELIVEELRNHADIAVAEMASRRGLA